VLLPLAGIAVVFVIIVREDRLARLHEAIQRVDPDEDTR
jgi:hypothetical protein